MRDCPEEKLVLLVNSRLSGLAKWQTERHLKACPRCQRSMTEITTLSQSLLALTTDAPRLALAQRIVHPQSQQSQSVASPRKLYPLLAPLLGMALGLLLTLSLKTDSGAQAITVGATTGLVLGSLVGLFLWLLKRVRFTVILPLLTSVLGLLSVPLWIQPRPSTTATIELAHPQNASALLDHDTVGTLIQFLEPPQTGRTFSSSRYTSWSLPPGQEITHFTLTGYGAYKDDPTQQIQRLQEWITTLQETPLLAKAGWELRVIEPPHEAVLKPSRNQVLYDCCMAFLVGLIFGLAILLLLWLGNVLPGGRVGCIVAGTLVGFLPSLSPQLRFSARSGFRPTVSATASFRITALPNQPTLNSTQRVHLLFCLTQQGARRIQDYTDKETVTLTLESSDVAQLRQELEKISKSKLMQVLGQRIEQVGTIQTKTTTTRPWNVTTFWANQLQSTFWGLLAGLFMAFTRRR
ncbi:hypothetical protein [Armatimonas sp.]|uniref:hypothetical protein n=1 Tax=Armatimonas sp. TaxID=1872638 RepID=UPI00375123DC